MKNYDVDEVKPEGYMTETVHFTHSFYSFYILKKKNHKYYQMHRKNDTEAFAAAAAAAHV